MIVEAFSYYSLALPDALTLWTVPVQGIRRWDDQMLVYDVGYGETVLRHYSFSHRWYAVNCTLDRKGEFVTEAGPIDWCFNIDIATPLLTIDDAAYQVDLCLDVLVGSNGKDYLIKDEDEFEHAVRQGWMTRQEQEGAQRGLEELLTRIHSGTLIGFLDAVCPFGAMETVPQQLPARKVTLGEVPLFDRTTRSQQSGTLLL